MQDVTRDPAHEDFLADVAAKRAGQRFESPQITAMGDLDAPYPKSTHTPGPWVWLGEPGRSHLNAAEGEVIAYYGTEGMHFASYSKPERDAANARLIAAAPELLDALRGVVGAWAENQGEHEFHNAMESVIEQVRDAIEKALP